MKRKSEDAQNNPEEQINKQINLGQGKGQKIQPQQNELGTIIKKCLAEKDYKNLVKSCQSHPEVYKEYKKLKFKNAIYTVDDPLLIANGDDPENDYIGKLRKIIRLDFGQVHTLIQLQWYYKKSDIPDKYESFKPCFSENELFLTEHLDFALVDCINGKCEILEYDEYDSLPSIPNNTFYMRAKFDASKKKFNPPLEKWKKGCICDKPLNPDLLYIQCDLCEIWIHTECVGIDAGEVDSIEHYECSKCTKKEK